MICAQAITACCHKHCNCHVHARGAFLTNQCICSEGAAGFDLLIYYTYTIIYIFYILMMLMGPGRRWELRVDTYPTSADGLSNRERVRGAEIFAAAATTTRTRTKSACVYIYNIHTRVYIYNIYIHIYIYIYVGVSTSKAAISRITSRNIVSISCVDRYGP